MAVPCFEHKLDTSSGHMDGEPRDTKFVQWIIHVYIPTFSHINEGTLHRIVDPRVKFHPYSLYYVILYDIYYVYMIRRLRQDNYLYNYYIPN